MPKMSLADQLDALKGKMSGLFSRSKKTAVEQTEGGTSESSLSQVKQLAPLVVAVAVLGGGGYTFQNDIMALIAPTPSNDQALALALPVVRAPVPVPVPAAEEIVTEVVSEPIRSLEIATEAQEETIELAAAPEKELAHNTDASDEMNLIERKLQAMQELQAMNEINNEESTTALEMAENEAMLVVAGNDESNVAQPFINTATSESMQSNQWTLWQASDQWAVQLMAVKTKKYLTDFISQNELEDGATYFEFTRDGEHYYALVVGVYNTHTEASEAAQTLAAEFKLEPWVRSMQSIQTAIDYDFNAPEATLALSQKF
ncbi:hypothetical protein MNBD_GAMMA17-657 [hydrothermal vent metagenome]|uniref:SPOR domain-containing protein n=1 Tax=hydrothermal vent metagenome TaxID=652676 RepID=A0A3B0ZM88_9ZZZZ